MLYRRADDRRAADSLGCGGVKHRSRGRRRDHGLAEMETVRALVRPATGGMPDLEDHSENGGLT